VTSGELARIALLARVLGAPDSKGANGARASGDGVVIGIGDDAALLDLAAHTSSESQGTQLVWTIDAQVEGTHFRRDLCSWEDVGWRSFMAAASDVAAMGGAPWCALSSLVLAPDLDDADLEALARGQRAASDAAGAPIVGGNLARGAPSSVTTTLLGTCHRERALTRGGARAGDALWLAGDVGLAAAGLRALERGLEGPSVNAAVAAWRRPRARFEDAVRIASSKDVHACIDVSDGLARDVLHLARASKLRAVLDAPALLGAFGARLADVTRALGLDGEKGALELALHGGEDYALVVACAEGQELEGFVNIGALREGEGLTLRDRDGRERALEARGFDHFDAG
jgi:thiamine-monophosphate kinase